MRLLDKIIQEAVNATLVVKALVLPHKPSVSHKVDFISQFANPEWAEKILKDGLPKTSDPNWKDSGALTVHEYEKWVTTICGMACTAMVLQYFSKGSYQIIQLAKGALKDGVYQEHLNELSSMRYKEYTRWVAGYGLSATLYSHLTLAGIKHIITAGGLVIASVSPNIRGYQTTSIKQVGGHLVLITGYSDKNNSITLHNPSGFVSMNTHCDHTLDYDDFKTYFAGRGIALFNK